MELPVFRLGCAGFNAEGERLIREVAESSRGAQWVCGGLAGADAWLLHGGRTQSLGEGRIRVAAAQAGGRSLQVQLAEAARPAAFSQPAPANLQAKHTFDLQRPDTLAEVLSVFEVSLAALQAQFWLAAHIIDQQEVMGAGVFELRARGKLIAVVDTRGEAAVLPSVRASNFDVAIWTRATRDELRSDAQFCRVSFPQLMWLYALRSRRDLLPQRYREGPVFFRRPPRVDPVLIEQEHLLVMRELCLQPSTCAELTQRLALDEAAVARALAALYYVGSVTTNPQRASQHNSGLRPLPVGSPQGSVSVYGPANSGRLPLELRDLRELTAPAPLQFA